MDIADCPVRPTVDVPCVPLSDVIGALSHALDLTEGQPPGHSVRCAWIGMHVGRALGLGTAELSDLYYTLLLKDAGCSSNAARLWELYGGDERLVKHDFKAVDSESFRQLGVFMLRHAGAGEALGARIRRMLHITRHGDEMMGALIQARCERGAEIVRRLGFSDAVAAGVYSLDEHWNGRGRNAGLAGDAIPVNARIALLAQVVDVFHTAAGAAAAGAEAQRRAGTWFDPRAVAAFRDVAAEPGFWEVLSAPGLDAAVAALEPVATVTMVDADRLDSIAEAFADIVDAKSSFTSRHSARVMRYGDAVAAELGMAPSERRWLRRASLLRDLGKLAVSNAILDKPGRLDAGEFATIKTHPAHSETILARSSVFADVAPIAGAHHERLDGGGYPQGRKGREIALASRIITVADIFDALTAARPYRGPMSVGEALVIMTRDRDVAIDSDCLAALERALPALAEAA